jgi:thiol:disulfide interchange protein
MKKKKSKYTTFLKWCLDECVEIKRKLFLSSYDIYIDMEPDKVDKVDYAFEIKVNYPYHSAHLKWKEATFNEWKTNKKEISMYLLHEMFHIVTSPLKEKAHVRYITDKDLYDTEEELVDRLTHIFENKIINKYDSKK